MIYSLSETENNIKWSSQKEIMLQAGIIKLCTTAELDGIEDLRRKVQELEQRINSGNIRIEQTKKNVETVKPNIEPVVIEKKKPNVNVQNIPSEEYWKNVLDTLKNSGRMVLYSNLIGTKASKKDDLTLEVIFPNGLTTFGKSMLEKPENMNEIARLVALNCGKEMRIKYIDAKEYVPKEENNIENVIKGLDIPVDIID